MLTTKCLYANAIISNNEKALEDIHLSTINIAIYERDITALSEELSQMMEQPVECKAIGTKAEVLSSLNDYFAAHFSNCTNLLADITRLVQLFENTTKPNSLRILLTTVSTNMCRKFHTDINDLRMLCTYVGPGTLWLPDELVDYKALQRRGDDQAVIKDPQQIQQVRTGDVVFLKGALYPEANPILHRSPSIEKKGEQRLLLRIDSDEFLNFWT